MKELRREKYLSKIRPFYNDKDIIKVLTGARRCGKSTIMKQIMDDLGTDTKVEKTIVYIDLDSKNNLKIRTPDSLEKLIDDGFRNCKGDRFLFVDEIQNVKGFEPLINAYRNDGVSVFITGSNSYLLSGELVTKLTGRYIEFRIFTFSLTEIEEFYTLNGISYSNTDLFQDYLFTGGYPKGITYTDQENRTLYIRSVIEETINKDILKSKKNSS